MYFVQLRISPPQTPKPRNGVTKIFLIDKYRILHSILIHSPE